MEKLRLTYFDIKGSRGQVARLAFALADMDFDDNRISFAQFTEARSSFPFGAVPILERDGQVLAQSNAINRYVGKLTSLYPTDDWQAALCDEVMDSVEGITDKIQPTMFLKDEAEKQRARAALAEGPIPFYLKRFAQQLDERGGAYFSDNRLTVADLKMFVWIRSLRLGILDHIPADLPDTLAPSLVEHQERVMAVDVIRDHYAD